MRSKVTTVQRRKDGTLYINIPAGVYRDTSFPIGIGDKVWVHIDGKRLVICKSIEHI